MADIKDYSGAGQTACGNAGYTCNSYTCPTCGNFVLYGSDHSCVYYRHPYGYTCPQPVAHYNHGPSYVQFNEILDKLRVIEEKLALISSKVYGGK